MAYSDIGNTMFLRLLEHERARQMEQQAAEAAALQNLAGTSRHIANMQEARGIREQQLAQTEAGLAAQTGAPVPQYEDPQTQRYAQVGAMSATAAQEQAAAQAAAERAAAELKHRRALGLKDAETEGRIDIEQFKKDEGHTSYQPRAVGGTGKSPQVLRFDQMKGVVGAIGKQLETGAFAAFINQDMEEIRYIHRRLGSLLGLSAMGALPMEAWQDEAVPLLQRYGELTGGGLMTQPVDPTTAGTPAAPAAPTGKQSRKALFDQKYGR